MLLAIDIGNTNVVCGLFDGSALRGHWRLATESRRTDNEYGILLLNLLHNAGFAPGQITGCILSSVVPALTATFDSLLQTYFHHTPVVVGPDIDSGLTIRYANPKEIGSDRIVNAAAAYAQYRSDLIIVDFGTATTFDVVSDDGSYGGGAIAPGINLSLEALHRAAAKLPRIAVEPPESVIGTSTISAMQSGVFWGYVGLIEGLVGRIQAEYGQPMTVVATGGLAPLFARRCPTLQHIDRDLTMAGLLEMYMINRELIRSGKGIDA